MVKPYKKENYKEVKKILEEADHFDKNWDSEENILGMIKNDPESVLIALEKNQVVGVIYLTLLGTKVGVIYRLVVKKEFRNNGIATSLIKYAEFLLKNKGVMEIGMYVDANNQELQVFYKKRNYLSSTNKPYVYMWKELSG